MNCLEARPGEPPFFQRREGRRRLCASPVPLRWEGALPSQRAQAGLPVLVPGFLSLNNPVAIWWRRVLCLPGAAPPPGPVRGWRCAYPGTGASAGSGTAPPPRAGERGRGPGRDGGQRRETVPPQWGRNQGRVRTRSSIPVLQQRAALRGPWRPTLRDPPSLRGVDVWKC